MVSRNKLLVFHYMSKVRSRHRDQPPAAASGTAANGSMMPSAASLAAGEPLSEPGALARWDRSVPVRQGAAPGENRHMVDDSAREQAIYQALKAADEVAAALQAHLIEEHQADLQRAAAQSTFTNSLKLLRQARERLGQGLRGTSPARASQYGWSEHPGRGACPARPRTRSRMLVQRAVA
jgi:hypothetical protein